MSFKGISPGWIASADGSCFASGDHRFEPVGQLHEFELPRLLGTVEGIAHAHLAQFGHRVDIAEKAVEQVKEPLKVIISIACWTPAKDFEQAFALRAYPNNPAARKAIKPQAK